MAKRRSGSAARRRLAALPEQIIERLLPGAARAGAEVVAADARQRLGGRTAETGTGATVLIADSVKVKVRRKDTKIIARIMLEGPGAYVGRWLEYGTAPHFITVDPDVRSGITARRTNARIADGDEALKATLIINGQAVGRSVFHTGSKPYPFLGPALATREDEAKATAQSYVVAHATRKGVVVSSSGGSA